MNRRERRKQSKLMLKGKDNNLQPQKDFMAVRAEMEINMLSSATGKIDLDKYTIGYDSY